MTMAAEQTRAHEAEFTAPAERAYDLIAGIARWPVLFPPCLAIRVLDRSGSSEHVRLWELADDDVRTWVSTRHLQPQALRVSFQQEAAGAPVRTISGDWRCEPVPGDAGRTRIRLDQRWPAPGDVEARHRVAAALQRRSTAEIDAIRVWAERPEPLTDLIFSFADRILIQGDPHHAYTFLHRADRWPDMLDHVTRLDLHTDTAMLAGTDVQTMGMETVDGNGTTHHTRSVRLCFANERIVYKQTTLPSGLLGHAGEWVITPVREGTVVTARHRVALDPAVAAHPDGTGRGLAGARLAVREALGANSRRTLEHARRFVESGDRPWAGAR